MNEKQNFIVLKVDRLFEWKRGPNSGIVDTIKKQKKNTKQEFDERVQIVIKEFSEQVCDFVILVRREWPSGQSAGLWVGRPGFESWMGHYVVALSKSLHSPCFVFSDKTLSRRSRLLQGLG